MSDLHDEPDDATPLTPDERAGLIPSHVATRGELNALEQSNIVEAVSFALRRRHDPLREAFARNLHRRMFGQVWRWAGRYRASDKNIGVPHWQVQTDLLQALGDTRYWIEHESYAPDEIAVRFHRDIVWVHPFANGNGRWSRLMADVSASRLGRPRFSWGGGGNLRTADETRRAYIAALRAADNHDYRLLLAFARS